MATTFAELERASTFLDMVAKSLCPHKWSCVLLPLPADISKQIVDWTIENVPDEHLGPGGRELRPHVTLAYGFAGDEMPEGLAGLLTRHGPVRLTLGNFSHFEGDNPDGTPLYLTVDSPDLHALREQVEAEYELPGNKHPAYVPHVCVAYLDPRFIDSYVVLERLPFQGLALTLTEAEWSDPDGGRQTTPLEFARQAGPGRFITFADLEEGAKALSWLTAGRGAELVPPPRQGRTVTPLRGRKLFTRTKAQCRQGQTEEQTNCTPVNRENGPQAGPRPGKAPQPPRQPAQERPQRDTSPEGGKAAAKPTQAARQAVLALGKAGLELSQKAGAAAKERINGLLPYVPEGVRAVLGNVWHGVHGLLMSLNHGAQALAKQLAADSGLDDEQVNRLAKTLAASDLLFEGAMMGATFAALAVAPPLALAAKAASYTPVASIGYILYSGKQHPIQTLKTAWQLLRDKFPAQIKGGAQFAWNATIAHPLTPAGHHKEPQEAEHKSLWQTRRKYLTKDRGQPCKPGERASLTGCIPASGQPGKPREQKPAPGQKKDNRKPEHREAHAAALQKIKSAPVPSPEAVKKARAELELARQGKARAGGEARGGSAKDRKKQRANLFKQFGGLERGYVVCPWTGIKMHWTDDPKLNPKGYPKFERGKIFVKCQGGGYQLANLIPESFIANRARNDKRLRKENAEGC